MTIALIGDKETLRNLVDILRAAGFVVADRQQAPLTENQIVVRSSINLWSATTVDYLLTMNASQMQLVGFDPYRTWLAHRGGVAAVLDWIQQVALAQFSPPAQAILRAMIDGEHYNVTAQRLFLSRARYYNARQQALAALSAHLNCYAG